MGFEKRVIFINSKELAQSSEKDGELLTDGKAGARSRFEGCGQKLLLVMLYLMLDEPQTSQGMGKSGSGLEIKIQETSAC